MAIIPLQNVLDASPSVESLLFEQSGYGGITILKVAVDTDGRRQGACNPAQLLQP